MIGFLINRKHARLRELASSCIDAQVAPFQRREFEERLASCEPCRLDLEFMRFTVGLLSDPSQIESPRDFILAQVPELVRAPRFLGWTTGLATSPAAALPIALLVGDITGLLIQTQQLEEAAFVAQPASGIARVAVPAAPIEVDRIAAEQAVEVAPAPVPRRGAYSPWQRLPLP